MKDLKFFLIGIIGGAFTLFLPVWLWNVKFLDYIDSHGKLIPFCLAPVFAMISAYLFVGMADIHKRMFGLGPDGKQMNPLWGWAAVACAIELIIVLLSNT